MSDTPNPLPHRTTIAKSVPSASRGTVYVSGSTSQSSDPAPRKSDRDGRSSPPASSSSAWRQRRYRHASSRLNPLVHRQDALSSDTSALSPQINQTPSAASLTTESTSSASEAIPSNTGPSSIPMPSASPTTSFPAFSTTSATTTRGDSPGSSSHPGGGQAHNTTSLGDTNPSTSPTFHPGDSTFLNPQSPPPSPHPSTFPTASVSISQAPQSVQIPNTTGSPVMTSPEPFTTTLTTSQTPVISTPLPMTLTETLTLTISTTIQDSPTTSISFSTSTIIMTSLPSGVPPTSTTTTTTTTSISGPSTSVDPTPTFTSSSTSVPVIASSTYFNASSTISGPILTSSSEDNRPTLTSGNFTNSFPFSSRLPASTSNTEAITHTSPSPTSRFLSTSTFTKYWTSTYPGGPTVTYTTVIESGVLGTDRSRPDDNAIAHNTGAIIGIALAGTFSVIILVLVIFFSCRRYKRNAERRGGDSIASGSGSRENFLRRELELDMDTPAMLTRLPVMEGNHGDEFNPGSGHHGPRNTDALASGTAAGGMMQDNPGAGPISYHLYPYDNGGGGGNGGPSANASAESAGMYPVQGHAYPMVGGVDAYTYVPAFTQSSAGVTVPPSPPLQGVTTSSEDMTRMTRTGSPPSDPIHWPRGSPTQLTFTPAYAYPYENPRQAMSGTGSGSASDPFGDGHAAAISSTSGHGHHSTDALTNSACLGSSSQGHVASNAGGVLTSSSGHGLSSNGGAGGVLTSSSGHGKSVGMGVASVGGRSKSNSPTAERRSQGPPSSYVPPRRGSGESSEGSGSDTSSIKGLLGRFRSGSKGKGKGKEKEKERERDRRKSLQYESVVRPVGIRRSSGDSMSMLMGHGTHSSLHGQHGPPSSLLNPPNPIPISMSMSRNDLPPVPAIRHPDMTVESGSMGYTYPNEYHHDPRYEIGAAIDDSPYLDVYPPPMFPLSPSPVPTDTSSYVEGLLNPHMLPSNSGGPNVPGISKRGGSSIGVGGSDGSSGGGGGGEGHGLWISEDRGGSVMSLRDNLDYSRPISGVAVMERTRSATTFGTDGGDTSGGT